MFLFLFVVLPVLCLVSLVVGMIYTYRTNQSDGEEHVRNGADQIATENIEEAIEEKKDIIYVSLCCVSVLLFLAVCYFNVSNSTTEPIERSDYGSGTLIIFLGGLTPIFMGFMFFVGLFIAVMMSLGSFMRFCARLLSCFIMCILFLFLVFASMG